MEQPMEVQEEIKSEAEVQVEEVENPKLEKAFVLFAEFHGALDEGYTPEQRASKYKELKTELETLIEYKEDIVTFENEFEQAKKEIEEKSLAYEELSKKYNGKLEENKVLKRIEKEFKAAKFGALKHEDQISNKETAQETYNRLLKEDPIEASIWYNKNIRK
jgi:hypothetical protein